MASPPTDPHGASSDGVRERRRRTIAFAMRGVLEKVAKRLIPLAKERGLEVPMFVSGEVPGALGGDPDALQRVLEFLGRHALERTTDGVVSVEITMAGEVAGSPVIRFEVKDNGEPLNATDLDQILRGQSHTDEDSSLVHEMILCKRWAESGRGTFEITSNADDGTRIVLTRPFRRIEIADNGPKRQAPPLHGVRILVVKHKADQRHAILRQLREWGAEAGEAVDGESAIALIKECWDALRPFDIVLLDHVMPGANGLELGRRINQNPDLNDVGLVLLTTSIPAHLQRIIERFGFAGCLQEPLQRTALLRALQEMTSTRAGQSARRHSRARNAAFRVLVAEDNLVNQKIITSMLANSAINIDVVYTGTEAVYAAEHLRYDVVLMDVNMPKMDGVSAAQAIKSLPNSKAADVPIVAVTADTGPEDRERYKQAGMVDCIGKPIDPAQLADVLEREGGIPARLVHIASGRPAPAPAVPENAKQDIKGLFASLDAMLQSE